MARHSRPRHGRDQPRHRFRSKPTDPTKQAAGIVKRLQGNRILSVGTARNYQERLLQIAAPADARARQPECLRETSSLVTSQPTGWLPWNPTTVRRG